LTPDLEGNSVAAMERCAFCKTNETALYDNGVPICLVCADARTKRKPAATDQQIRGALLQNIIELTARIDEATLEFDAATRQIPSGRPHSAGVQRIKNASNKLSIARAELMKAHRRLEHGSVPDDLKRSG
jgi:hypothetical protein